MCTAAYICNKKRLEEESKYLSYSHAFDVRFFSLLINKNIVCMSAGFPSNTHKQYGDTVFPNNVPPLQSRMGSTCRRGETRKKFSLTVANNPASFIK